MARVVLAEYFVGEEQTLLFLVSAANENPLIEAFDLPAEAALGHALDSFGGMGGARSVDLGSWQEWFGQLIAPIVQHTDEGDLVWFVPHGPLHYLPLHALRIGGRFLIERNPVCYTPSASIMKYCKAKRTGGRDRAVVVGDSRDDLAHAREEATAVAELFGVRPYLGAGATKAAIRDALAGRGRRLDVLHIACHGYFDSRNALRSGILLAPDPEDSDRLDGALTVEELLGTHLEADLITLSACESGVSEHRPGDELIGLTRALIYAGTPSVIVSLWRADDLAAGLIMKRFYELLLRSRATPDKAHALQQAQLHVMRMTARQIIDDCAARLNAMGNGDRARRPLLEMQSASAYAVAGDLDAAIDLYDRVAQQAGAAQLQSRAGKTSDVLRFKQRARTRGSAAPDVNFDVRPFEHPAHWAPFILVGDWE